jgi:uncharacterized protein (DUF983 family)
VDPAPARPTGERPDDEQPDVVPLPGAAKMLWRAATKGCAVCGERRLFHRWFTMKDRCPRCGLRFERIEGHWTGDLGINTVVSFGVLLITLFVGVFTTYPDVPAAPLLLIALGVAALVPFVFYPFSKTIWLAIDLLMRPLESGEVEPGAVRR